MEKEQQLGKPKGMRADGVRVGRELTKRTLGNHHNPAVKSNNNNNNKGRTTATTRRIWEFRTTNIL